MKLMERSRRWPNSSSSGPVENYRSFRLEFLDGDRSKVARKPQVAIAGSELAGNGLHRSGVNVFCHDLEWKLRDKVPAVSSGHGARGVRWKQKPYRSVGRTEPERTA